jgi:hypothetical protein
MTEPECEVHLVATGEWKRCSLDDGRRMIAKREAAMMRFPAMKKWWDKCMSEATEELVKGTGNGEAPVGLCREEKPTLHEQWEKALMKGMLRLARRDKYRKYILSTKEDEGATKQVKDRPGCRKAHSVGPCPGCTYAFSEDYAKHYPRCAERNKYQSQVLKEGQSLTVRCKYCHTSNHMHGPAMLSGAYRCAECNRLLEIKGEEKQ